MLDHTPTWANTCRLPHAWFNQTKLFAVAVARVIHSGRHGVALLQDITIGQKDDPLSNDKSAIVSTDPHISGHYHHHHHARAKAGIVVALFDRDPSVITDAMMISGNRRTILSATKFKTARNATVSLALDKGVPLGFSFCVRPCSVEPR